MSITIMNTYGTPHQVSPSNPAHVTSCTTYRCSLVITLPSAHPDYADMVKALRDNGRDSRPEGYGVILLESEEDTATYFGSFEQAEQYHRDGTLDTSQGVLAAGWPQGKGWDALLPRIFWNQRGRGAAADGVGIVTAFAHINEPSAQVIVYEFEGARTRRGETQQLVTYHCTACHQNSFHDSGHVHENTGPDRRRWAARQARQHILSAHHHGIGSRDSACRPNGGEMLRAMNAVARDMWGTTSNAVPDTDAAYCATKGPCSIIRELRVGARPQVYNA
ncbi:hypothetical protein [Streptomyces sp. NEAU-H3]|uniref:hypothetical protein n=1 Tax=Streptomyces sp. NEAU-H3 TaxID=2720636 RepID=UPI001438CB32|nr:hypothetical protein [Streptomyces sp. NEAU-H3]NJA56661.1 hypothetical protein [Streptomyces sp. NEAU-H3]